MKIAFYISSLSGGGAEKVLCTLANRLAQEDNEVHVISLEKRKQFYTLDDRVVLHKVDNAKKRGVLGGFLDFIFIKKMVKKIKADLSISFLLRTNLLLLFSNLFTKEKIIVCDRNNPVAEHSQCVFQLSNLLYKRADRIVVQTNQIKDFYDRSLQQKIFVIENPIDRNALYAQIAREELEKTDTVISIGRLEPQKDFRTLIFAFSKIMHRFPSWKLKIFGVGNMHDELRGLIHEQEADDRIELCGQTQKPFLELKKSRIFVLSSNYEGFPNALCEAMEAGLSCIVSDCISGPRELITDGVNGYLFAMGNVNELAEKMEFCMKEGPSLRELQERAKESVKHLYLENNIKIWKQFFAECCE